MLLPDGRIIMGGGGAPGPVNYPDVEFYSPGYLFTGNATAARPTINTAPAKVAYGTPFQLGVTGTVSRVTMVRAGSVTHSFDNGQRFFEPTFTTAGTTLTVQAPASGAIAPPGTWMVFAIDAAGKPSVGKLVEIDPATAQVSTRAALVEQFEYPRIRPSAAAVNVPAGDARMAPWNVTSAVGLLPATRVATAPYDSIGEVGYQVNLGATGALSRGVGQLETGRQYRLSFRYARNAGVAVPAGATVAGTVSIANLSATVTATADLSSSGRFGSYTGSFTASGTSHSLALAAAGTSAGMMIDNLVISAIGPGDPPLPPITTPTTGMVQYKLNETSGTVAANTGTDTTVPAASLSGTASWDAAGRIAGSVRLPGGASTTANYVNLPDNLLATSSDFTAAMWVKAQVAPAAWTPVLNIGQTTSDFFLIQANAMSGADGLVATFRSGNGPELRVQAGDANDLRVGQWVHVAVTKSGTTARIYVDGVERGVNTGVTFSFPQIAGGVTTDNYVGHSSWADPNLNASVDDLRLYPTALTAAQVAVLAAS